MIKNHLEGLNIAARTIHKANVAKGFYDEPKEIGTLLMLCVSELAEALEADREGNTFKKLLLDFRNYRLLATHSPTTFAVQFKEDIKDTFEDEIADTVIRLLDLCGYLKIDIEQHVDLKLKYNATRPVKHGKKY